MGTPQTPYAPKMGTLVNLNRVVVPSKEQASLSVAVRVRPILKTEQAKNNKRDIIRVIDDKVVVVLDPDECKDYLDQVQNRTKEKKYTFDMAYDTQAHNSDVYQGVMQELASGVSRGLNGTVFAYGSTGSGKTHTMVGTPSDPGLMVLSLSQIFREKAALGGRDEEFTVTASYLEVYNEVIYDLLVKSSGPLELREDPDQGVCVAGLQRTTVTSAAEIMGLLEAGNQRRKTDSTDANATSSRSHAVLEIVVRRTPLNQYRANVLIGKLTLVDLAGSERAAETNNQGQKLRDGANINKSLLALANCINALGKQQKTGVAYVPYRNSKLTRLLKDSLRGNSRTAMIATISAASDQYHHSVNTLKYADRAKEIKTHVVQNVGSVERHITDYQNIIDNLQSEVQSLKARLAERRTNTALLADGAAAAGGGGGDARSGSEESGGPGNAGAAAAGGASPNSSDSDLLAWIDGLAQEINDNVEERINLQKALFELEDINVCNKYELQNIDDMLSAASDALSNPAEAAEASERRDVLVEEMAENSAEAERYRADIAANEACRREIQARIETAIDANSNVNFLKILSTFRIQAVRLQELKFQMAVRDQIITEQRDVISNLWAILEASGLTRQQVLDIARAEGIVMRGLEHEGSPPALGTLPVAGPAAGAVGGASISGGVALPGETTGVKQSLMAGKARFRYRFWQQYGHGAESHSTSGVSSPIQTLHSPVLLQDPPHSSRTRGAAAAGSSKVPAFPALASKAVVGHDNVRAASPLRGWPGLDEQPQEQQQQQWERGRLQQATSSATPGKARGAGADHTKQQQQQQQNQHHQQQHKQQHQQQPHQSGSSMSLLGALKRYNLQPPSAAGGDNSNSSSSHHRQHSLGNAIPSDHALPAAAAAAVSNAMDPANNPRAANRSHSARRGPRGSQQHSSTAAPAAGSSKNRSSSVPTLRPGLPGQQQQVASAVTALRKVQQAQITAAGSGKAAMKEALAAGTAGMLYMQPQQQQHQGMLAWQESPHGAAVSKHHQHQQKQQQQQQQQQSKAQQLSAVYGGAPVRDRLAKLRQLKNQQQQGKAASAAVSTEASQADLLPERSAASAYSSPATLGGGAAGAGSNHSLQPQHQQGATPSTSAGSPAAAVLPVITETKPLLAELRRRQQLQQLQMLQQHRASMHAS